METENVGLAANGPTTSSNKIQEGGEVWGEAGAVRNGRQQDGIAVADEMDKVQGRRSSGIGSLLPLPDRKQSTAIHASPSSMSSAAPSAGMPLLTSPTAAGPTSPVNPLSPQSGILPNGLTQSEHRVKRSSVAADFWGFTRQNGGRASISSMPMSQEEYGGSYHGSRHSSVADLEQYGGEGQYMRFRCWNWVNSMQGFGSVVCSGLERWAAVLSKGDEGISLRSLYNDIEQTVYVLENGSLRSAEELNRVTDPLFYCTAMAVSPDEKRLVVACSGPNQPNGRHGPSRLLVLSVRDLHSPDALSPSISWSSGSMAESTMSHVRKMWWGADKDGAKADIIACCNKSSITVWRRVAGFDFQPEKARDIADDLLEKKSQIRALAVLSSSILSISGSAKRKVLAVAIGEMGTARKESIVRLLSLDPDRPGFYPYVREHKTTIQTVWMSEDGTKLALGGGDRTVTVLDMSLSQDFGKSSAFGDVLYQFGCDHTVTCLWGPSDSSFLVAGAGSQVGMWSLWNGIKVHEYALSSQVKACSGSADGSVVAACSAKEVQVRNFASRDIEATHHSFTELSRIQDQRIIESCPQLFCGLLLKGEDHLNSLRSIVQPTFKTLYGSPDSLSVAIVDASDEILVTTIKPPPTDSSPIRATQVNRRASVGQATHRRSSVGGRRGSVQNSASADALFKCAAGTDVQALWMSPDAQMLAAGGVDLLSVWDTESDSEKPKSIIDCSGHVVHAIWGSEDGTYLVYLVTDKRVDLHQTAAENDYSGMELDDKQANDNMIHAKLHVYHTGFESTWGSTIPVEDVELVDEHGSDLGPGGGSRSLNWQGFVCIDEKMMTVREKATRVVVRDLGNYTMTPKHEFENLTDKVSGLAMWGPSEKKLLALIHPTEIRVVALETEAVLHSFKIADVWAVWSSIEGQGLRVCAADGVTEWNLERLFEVGPSFKRFEEYAKDRHLPDPQLHNRICTDLSLFHDRQGYLARDGSFLNLLLGKGFHQAMSRFLVVHPAAVQSPFEEMNAMLGPRSVLEAALDSKSDGDLRPEVSLDILLKAVLVSMDNNKLSLGCMEVVSKFVEKALEKERHEKVERAVFEFLASMKLVDLELEHLPHCSERMCWLHNQVSPYKTVEESKPGVLRRFFAPLIALIGASKILEEKSDTTIWGEVEDDVYSHEAQACIIPIPLPEGRFIQRNLITNPISFQSDVVACVVEALWNEKFKALFRWQAFVYLVLTVCYTFFCLTCATSDKSFIDQMEDSNELMVVGFVLGAVSVFLSALFLVYEMLQITFKYQTLIVKARDEKSYSASEQLPLKIVTFAATLKGHYESLWNVLASVCFLLNVSSFVVYVVQADNVTIRATSSLGVVSIWLYTLYFARGWDEWAKLVSMLVEILRDMLPFLLVMAILVITHASGFVVVHSGTREGASEFEAMNSAVQQTLVMGFLGSWTEDQLISTRSESLTWISYGFFYALEFTILIVSLNALIGIMGQTQGRVLDMAQVMIQRQRVSIILDIMDIEDYISKSSVFAWCCRPRKIHNSPRTPKTPFRERKWVHVLQPKPAPKDTDPDDLRPVVVAAAPAKEFNKDHELPLPLAPSGGDAGLVSADGQAALLEVAEKLPNIEMLLSKIMQGTERLTPIMNLVQKSWVLASQLEGAHAKHDRRTLDLLKDLADKATAEKVALQAEVKQRAAEAEALRVEKAALEAKAATLEKANGDAQQQLQLSQSQLAVTSSQLQQYQQLYQQQQEAYQRQVAEEVKQNASAPEPSVPAGEEGVSSEGEKGKAEGGAEAKDGEGGKEGGASGQEERDGEEVKADVSPEAGGEREEISGARDTEAVGGVEGGGGKERGEKGDGEQNVEGATKQKEGEGGEERKEGGAEKAAGREGGSSSKGAGALAVAHNQVGGPGPMMPVPLALPGQDGKTQGALMGMMPPMVVGGGEGWAGGENAKLEDIRKATSTIALQMKSVLQYLAAMDRPQKVDVAPLVSREPSFEEDDSAGQAAAGAGRSTSNFHAAASSFSRTISLPANRMTTFGSSQQLGDRGLFATARSRESQAERDKRRAQELLERSPYAKAPARIQRTTSQGGSSSNLNPNRPRTMGSANTGHGSAPAPLRSSVSDLGAFGAQPSTSVDHRAGGTIQVPLAGSLPARSATLSSRRLQLDPPRFDQAGEQGSPGSARSPPSLAARGAAAAAITASPEPGPGAARGS